MILNSIKLAIAIIILIFPAISFSQHTGPRNSGEIGLALEKLNTLGSVLYIAAHPDDENTRLLSYLANERKYRTVYLSLTRGDGGQNLIGKEQGAELGMIRTKELLAARSVDGAEQTFTRSNDFGYSKTPEETFSIWNKEEILADVVWAIRKYKPDVIINRFPTTGEGGHGHHTASAILAVEAFHAAADPNRFKEQLKYVDPWQAKRIFHNSFNFRNQPPTDYTGQIKLDVGGYNPLLGKSYGEIAAESRSMHKSQGFGVPSARGIQYEHFRRLDGDTMVNEIFENINTGWTRIKGGAAIEAEIRNAIKAFDPTQPQKITPALVKLLTLINDIDDKYWKNVKKKEILDLIAACSGLWFEVNSKDYYAAPGDSVQLTFSAIARMESGLVLKSVKLNGLDTALNVNLKTNEVYSITRGIQLPNSASFTNPYWLNEPFDQSTYTVKDQLMRGEPWNESALNTTFSFVINGETISYSVPVSYKWTDPVKGEIYRPFEIVPAVSITPVNDVIVFNSPELKVLKIKIKSNIAEISGKLKINAPEGWKISTINADELEIVGLQKGKEIVKEIRIVPPSTNKSGLIEPFTTASIYFESSTGKSEYSVQRIEYDHIPAIVFTKKCTVKLVIADIKTRNVNIGYIEGAGDDVAKCLKQAGFAVDILDENTILNSNLSRYKAIITGIRAYNTIENIDEYYQPLMKYVENGGNLIVQYNTNNFISSAKSMIGPYPFKISRERVTDEKATVKFLKPDHSLLNKPNKITDADFNHWIQERGLYFANELSPEYETILSWNDPGEKPLDGGLIFAKKGKGNFMYTGISFFRELPAGIPGAYKLLVNMIFAGEE